MAAVSSSPSRPSKSAAAPSALPHVRLELRHANARPTAYEMTDVAFLVGSVPGCDLRIPGANLPPVLCLLSRRPDGVDLRKLTATQTLQVNGRAVTTSPLKSGDTIRVAAVDLVVQVTPAAEQRSPDASSTAGENGLPAGLANDVRQQLTQQLQRLRDDVVRFQEQRDVFEAEEKQRLAELRTRAAELDEREQHIRQKADAVEKDHTLSKHRRAESEREAQEYRAALDAYRQQVQAQQNAEIEKRTDEFAEKQRALDTQVAELDSQRQEIATVRQELADIRRQLYDRYRERRDRLSGLQESVNRAARKVQESKRELESETRQLDLRHREVSQRQAVVDAKASEVEQTAQRLDEERQSFERLQAEMRANVDRRLAECQLRENQLETERGTLESEQAQYRDDLVRLDRLQAALHEREQNVATREHEVQQRLEQLQTDIKDVELQVQQLDEWHSKLTVVGERIAKQKAEADAATSQIAQRAAALEGQQAALATLRTRLERMREDVRRDEQDLAEQRAKQESLEKQLQERLEAADRLRFELEQEKTLQEQDRQQLVERSATLEAAVEQLRLAKEKLAAEETQLSERMTELDLATAQQTEQARLAQERAAQLQELQKRLEAEHDALRERNQLLAQAEQSREALQEQLRRRSEELAARQKALNDQIADQEAAAKQLDERRGQIEREFHESQCRLQQQQQETEAQSAQLDSLREDLAARTEHLEKQRTRLQESGRQWASERKSLAEERSQLAMEKLAFNEAMSQIRAEFESKRKDAADLQRRLPELELRAGGALERLTHAREQLRDHLAEVHQYARHCQEDLESVRVQLQTEAGRLAQQEQSLRRGHEEQRLAGAAFRQQLIDWQGQIGEMKRLLAQDETRLMRRRDEVTEQARKIDADSIRLAQETQQLEVEQRVVSERRQEVDRHLVDMRDWYRRKLRELAGIHKQESGVRSRASGTRNNEATNAGASKGASQRDILSVTGSVEPADRKLGDLLRSLELIEADTLTVLLIEARRQRRSLRQVLLASGAVTVYQMALIESGNLDALMLGPVRVIDRLRTNSYEAVYRVFDPRRGRELMLRHLAESADAARREEFCRSFSQAILEHPNLASTLEVLDVGGRPAVLQEWLTGLPSTEWPPLSAAPGVWLRLLRQAAAGLAAAHQAGLAHGHLQPGLLLLTSDGIVKTFGVGEPAWLAAPAVPPSPIHSNDARGRMNDESIPPSSFLLHPSEVAADLDALGRIAAGWCAAHTRGKGRALTDPLPSILSRLQADHKEQFATATELLESLDQASTAVPLNSEAWDRLVRHARDHATPQVNLRQSA